MPKVWRGGGFGVLAGLCLLLAGCGKQSETGADAAEPVTGHGPSRQLALARVANAGGRMRAYALDEALAWAVSALEADPECPEAGDLVRRLLAETRWPVARWELEHQLRVEHLAFSPPATLWVALGEPGEVDGFNTVLRWDTAALKLEAVMFPARGAGVRSMVAGAGGRGLILQRGSGDDRVHLLCDAQSLRPVAGLGPVPPELTTEAVVVTSASGLLLAHPEPQAGDARQLVWRIRDVATGGIVRSSDPVGPELPLPVAAWLDDRILRVLHRDGSLAEMPVSPLEPVVVYHPAKPTVLLQARFSEDGESILGLWSQGAGCPPLRRTAKLTLSGAGGEPVVAWEPSTATPDACWWDAPWCGETGWWQSLLRDHGVEEDRPALRIEGANVVFTDGQRAPIRGTRELTAVVGGPGLLMTGSQDGRVRMYEWLPQPDQTEEPTEGKAFEVPALARLSAILTGLRYAPETGGLVGVERGERDGLLDQVGVLPDGVLMPGFDFSQLLGSLRQSRPRSVPAAVWQPLWERLAMADSSGKSWPRWLHYGQALGDSQWHQDLSEALALSKAEAEKPAAVDRPDDLSPWLARQRMREIFQQGDESALRAELAATGGTGPAMATALGLALDGNKPAWIALCLETAVDLPPLLMMLAQSRIAWLEKQPAAALACWPDEFPRFSKIRAGDDWHGWEQEDFAPRYEAHLKDLRRELKTYDVASAATAGERQKTADRLLNPGTRSVIGRRRLADHCMKGALRMAELGEKPELVQQLARRARDLGAPPEPCLRVEALAQTHLNNYAAAHPLWVKLLTEYPVETHLATDYAEGAYTAFEVGDPGQAMDILTTGINRFGEDAGFALRAGWIALLTGNSGRGYQYLLAGLRVGFAKEQEENACLLLAVAASLAGFPQDAATHYLRLVEIQPKWEDPETVDGLDWPEELKAAIRQLISGPGIDLPELPMDSGGEELPEW